MSSTTPSSSLRVFISYAHERDLRQQVKALAEYLLKNGIQAITDHPYENQPPEKGWRAWMQHNVEDADFVLVVCTPRYKALFEKRELPPTEPEGGYGVTWESAIITDDLYQSKLTNTRFFPILPDAGSANDIPAVLRDFHNGHRFPSGYDRILKLIKEEVRVPKPQPGFNAYLAGELRGVTDSRLTPREQAGVIGRDDLIEQVVNFLKGDESGLSVSGYVSGCGGIGKTEVCKAALAQWLASDASARAFWIQVPDNSEPPQLLQLLGRAVDIPDEQLAQITQFEQLADHLPSALYYLDNLESMADSPEGLALLRKFSELPQVRILASSRVSLDSIWSNSIEVEPLLLEDAITLFLETWNGKAKPNREDVADFVQNELGCHPLSIVLIARLGKGRSYAKVIELWQQKGTVQAKQKGSQHRHDSLEKALVITVDQLKTTPTALHLWQFIALYNEGVEEAVLDSWDKVVELIVDGMEEPISQRGFGSDPEDARVVLLDHHLIQQQENGYFSMLPPLARYALEPAQRTESADTVFRWPIAKQLAYLTFLKVSERASEIASTPELIDIHHRSASQIPSILQLVKIDKSQERMDCIQLLEKINFNMLNVYRLNYTDSLELLDLMKEVISEKRCLAKILKVIGDIRSIQEQPDNAMVFYQKSKRLFESIHDLAGLAGVLKSMGDLERLCSNPELAMKQYLEALKYCETAACIHEKANVLNALAYLEFSRRGASAARNYVSESKILFEQFGDSLGLGNSWFLLGLIEWHSGNKSAAWDYYSEAKAIFESLGARLDLANTLTFMGELKWLDEDDKRAVELFNDAIDIYKSENAQVGCAGALTKLADVYIRINDFDRALGYLDEALSLCEFKRDFLGAANILLSKGDIEKKRGDLDSAGDLYCKAKGYYIDVRGFLGQGNALKSLGDIKRISRDFDEALCLYSEAIRKFNELNSFFNLAYAYSACLECYSSQVNEDEITNFYAVQAILNADKSGSKSAVSYVYDTLVNFFDGDREQAQAFWNRISKESNE